MSGPHAVVTGGTGFLMAHVIREWLCMTPAARVTAVGRTPPDAEVLAYLEDLADRITFVEGDARTPARWADRVRAPVDFVVHGAALCPLTAAEERALWSRTVDVNVMGTVAVLDWAAAFPDPPSRVVYISSGVYGYGRPCAPDAPPDPPVTEDAPLVPHDATYDITKAAGEWLVARWSAMTGIEALSVRPSAIFGPLDRDTEGRTQHPAPWHIARAALAGRTLCVNDLRAAYDWLYAPDAGRAIAHVLRAARPRHTVYNVGFGRATSLADLAEGARRVCPDFEMIATDKPDVMQPMDRRGGVWSVRDTTRLETEFGWSPTPLPEAMAHYLCWLKRGVGTGGAE